MRLTVKLKNMKASVITILLCSLFIVPTFASTDVSGDEKADKKNTRVERIVRRAIDKAIIFPVDQQGEELQGTVDVSFKIDDAGRVKVVNIESSNPELMDYVLAKLKKIKLDSARSHGETIRYRFVFKQQS